MLPTDWLSDKGASVIASALDSLLQDVAQNPGHRLRQAFDSSIQRLIDGCRTTRPTPSVESCATICCMTRSWPSTCASYGPAGAPGWSVIWPTKIRPWRGAPP
jgi:hypothetical protein